MPKFYKEKIQGGPTPQMVALPNEIRTRAMHQAGCLYGETLVRKNYPHNMIVISTWRSLEDWHQWRDCDERRTFESMLEIYPERGTDYDEYLLGSPLHREK